MILILSAPSGCGKDTIAARLAQEDKGYEISVSMTTRPMREGDQEGVTYHFVSEEQFLTLQKSDRLFESACYNGNYYGTPKEPIENWLREDKTVILVIEVEGAENMRRLFPDAVSVFVLPPSLDALEQRLRNRQTESEIEISKRLLTARKEIARAGEFHYIIINDDLEDAVRDVKAIMTAQQYTADKMKQKIKEVLNNG